MNNNFENINIEEVNVDSILDPINNMNRSIAPMARDSINIINSINDLLSTRWIEVEKSENNIKYKPVVDVASPTFTEQETVFKLLEKNYRRRTCEVDATPENIAAKYFPIKLIEHI